LIIENFGGHVDDLDGESFYALFVVGCVQFEGNKFFFFADLYLEYLCINHALFTGNDVIQTVFLFLAYNFVLIILSILNVVVFFFYSSRETFILIENSEKLLMKEWVAFVFKLINSFLLSVAANKL
jgi:hypothetical protein